MTRTAISALNDTAALRLVCFSHAGGGVAMFHRWRAALPGWLDLVPITLPGHDGRLGEAPCTDLRRLAGVLVDELKTIFIRPYALLGHSMGAWLAFELARAVRRQQTACGLRPPELLVVAASRPPHARSSEPPIHLLPDDELVAEVDRRYGGIPAGVRASRELLQLLLPALRADLQMIETYDYDDERPLGTPILALGGTEDSAVSVAELGEWRRHTTGEFSLRLFPGRHFFLFAGRPAAGSARATTPASEIPPALRAILGQLERCMPFERSNFHAADETPPD